MNAMASFHAIRAATIAAKDRTGDKSLATRVDCGRFQLCRVTYDKKGRATVAPITEWIGAGALIGELNAL